MLKQDFFNRDTKLVAKDLLGKIIKVKYNNIWLAALIIETEAYYKFETVSHSFKGISIKNEAMFMPPGTIYMYYSYGKDSLNISCKGKGNAVLVKSGYPYHSKDDLEIKEMQRLNPKSCGTYRNISHICKGQTLLCRSLNLKVKEWNKRQFDKSKFYIKCNDYKPEKIIETLRLGINGKEKYQPLRFIDKKYLNFCTKKPKQL